MAEQLNAQEQAQLRRAAELMANALQWYQSKSKAMGNAAIHQDNQAMLATMKELSVDYGHTAAVALAEFRRVEKTGGVAARIEGAG